MKINSSFQTRQIFPKMQRCLLLFRNQIMVLVWFACSHCPGAWWEAPPLHTSSGLHSADVSVFSLHAPSVTLMSCKMSTVSMSVFGFMVNQGEHPTWTQSYQRRRSCSLLHCSEWNPTTRRWLWPPRFPYDCLSGWAGADPSATKWRWGGPPWTFTMHSQQKRKLSSSRVCEQELNNQYTEFNPTSKCRINSLICERLTRVNLSLRLIYKGNYSESSLRNTR